MDEQRGASATALDVAALRAAHLLIDPQPWIFEDHLALPLLGDEAAPRFQRFEALPREIYGGLRLIMTNRSRYTEERLGFALRAGIDQYVMLGAGLDSFAYRSPLASKVRTFEVDLPASQRFKRDRLAAIGHESRFVTYVPTDFATESVDERLATAGLDRARPVFISWLGVTQYLDMEAIASTLRILAGMAPGSEIVLTYIFPPRERDVLAEAIAASYEPGAARSGEPWITALSAVEARELVESCGLQVQEQIERTPAVDRALSDRSDSLTFPRLSGLVRAVVP